MSVNMVVSFFSSILLFVCAANAHDTAAPTAGSAGGAAAPTAAGGAAATGPAAANGPATVFDVRKFAKGGDLSPGLVAAFKEACATAGPAKVLIPEGTFPMGVVNLDGPCKGAIEIEVKGKLQAPAGLQGINWISINRIDQFLLHGGGEFDAQGDGAWKLNNCHKTSDCANLPISIRFNFITNGTVRDITSTNSKHFHMNVIGCKNLQFVNIKINAPGDSPNTDGIHIGRSDGVNITDSVIKTGDDCISIGDGTQNLRVTGVHCGPGHGFAVGSLGRFTKEEPVTGIWITKCTMENTVFGVRIKTWPASACAQTATDIHFEDITMTNVTTPVLIDQEYCPWNQCNKKVPSKIKISSVTIKNIKGTSANKEAVKLVCSKDLPCEQVEIGDIDLTYAGPDGPATFSCCNIKPTLTGKQNPAACSSPVAAPPQ